jgi:hypothetical protein
MENTPDNFQKDNQPDNSRREREEEAMIPGEAIAAVTPARAALMSSSERIARAAKALSDMGPEADNMAPGTLAKELSRRTGVGFEAGLAVALSTRPRLRHNTNNK